MSTQAVLAIILAGLAIVGAAAGVFAFFRVKLSGATIENYEIANRSQKARLEELEAAKALTDAKLDHATETLERQTREIQDLQRMVLQRAEVAEVANALREHDQQAARRHDKVMAELKEVRRRAHGE